MLDFKIFFELLGGIDFYTLFIFTFLIYNVAKLLINIFNVTWKYFELIFFFSFFLLYLFRILHFYFLGSILFWFYLILYFFIFFLFLWYKIYLYNSPNKYFILEKNVIYYNILGFIIKNKIGILGLMTFSAILAYLRLMSEFDKYRIDFIAKYLNIELIKILSFIFVFFFILCFRLKYDFYNLNIFLLICIFILYLLLYLDLRFSFNYLNENEIKVDVYHFEKFKQIVEHPLLKDADEGPGLFKEIAKMVNQSPTIFSDNYNSKQGKWIARVFIKCLKGCVAFGALAGSLFFIKSLLHASDMQDEALKQAKYQTQIKQIEYEQKELSLKTKQKEFVETYYPIKLK